jgi:hypothetical protein
MAMSQRAWRGVMAAVFGLALGVGVAIGASGKSETTTAGSHRLKIASSATGVQSFAWILDDGSNTVTFCYTTASPQMGPQFDFTCKRHPMPTE